MLPETRAPTAGAATAEGRVGGGWGGSSSDLQNCATSSAGVISEDGLGYGWDINWQWKIVWRQNDVHYYNLGALI